MIRLIFFLLIILFLILLFLLKNSKRNSIIKSIVGIFLIVTFVFGYFYESEVKKSEYELRDELIVHFEQGGTLSCNGTTVDKDNFGFSYASSSFIAKKEAKVEFQGLVFDIKECKK